MKTGIFWVIFKEENDLWTGNFRFIKHFGNDIYHKRVWINLVDGKAVWEDCPFFYFPRGRVEKTDNKKYEIILNPMLDVPPVIQKIKDVFDLNLNEVKIVKDSTGEYKCSFDKEI